MYKKKRMFSSLLVLALVLMAIALSGCVEEDVNKIIIGTSADFPPFEYMEPSLGLILRWSQKYSLTQDTQ